MHVEREILRTVVLRFSAPKPGGQVGHSYVLSAHLHNAIQNDTNIRQGKAQPEEMMIDCKAS